jgi:hypothetical protein
LSSVQVRIRELEQVGNPTGWAVLAEVSWALDFCLEKKEKHEEV